MLAIERALGRVRLEKWGPRTIDLDLLFIEGMSVDDPRLVVPHPHLRERAFALLPLLDVLPDAHVGTERLADLRIDPAGVRKTDLSLF
jgi:2-amino-4-hydroxy-6-hydroxymethyldihydropteridine diphosphokinase